jgi:ribosome-binding protein aMBF1 (putative translation factor)
MENLQDWKNVTWTKKIDPKLLPKTLELSTKKKNLNTINNTVTKITNYDDNLTEYDNIKPVMVSKEFGQLMQTHRTLLKMTREDLAKKISLPIAIIRSYETGTGVRNGTYISKIKKVLNIS